MSFTNVDYLKNSQYRNSNNFGVRVRFHQRFSTNPYGAYRWMFDHLLENVPQNAHLLELGGGSGELWKQNKDRIPPEWHITLSDFSPGMLDDAKKNLRQTAARINAFEVIDAQNIPCEDALFDAVIANLMLYHVPDRAKAIAEMSRILKPDGVLFVMTLGMGHMHELYEWVREVVPELNFDLKHTDSPFSLENGAEQLEAQFKNIRVEHYEDSVAVTDVRLLREYIASLEGHTQLLKNNALSARFRKAAQAAIQDQGAIRAKKATGMFIAYSR